MNPLRTLENMIAGLVEGTFGRVFKAEVRPMELAHKLAREMDENKTISVSRVYAPNEYSVWLSPRDRARYEGVEQEVIDELCAYLLEHARGEDLALASRPQIVFHTDESLQLGEFGIEARLARLEEDSQESEEAPQPTPAVRGTAAAPARGSGAYVGRSAAIAATGSPAAPPAPVHVEPEEVGNTMIFSNSQRTRDAVEQTSARRRPKALLLVSGRRLLVAPRGATIGRSRDCDIVLEDSSISRRHAELRPGGQGWTIEDLGSTNGVRVNGNTVHGPREVRTGDRIEIGSTEMLFEIAP
jgi:predicted component of type VI protein secretion system